MLNIYPRSINEYPVPTLASYWSDIDIRSKYKYPGIIDQNSGCFNLKQPEQPQN